MNYNTGLRVDDHHITRDHRVDDSVRRALRRHRDEVAVRRFIDVPGDVAGREVVVVVHRTQDAQLAAVCHQRGQQSTPRVDEPVTDLCVRISSGKVCARALLGR